MGCFTEQMISRKKYSKYILNHLLTQLVNGFTKNNNDLVIIRIDKNDSVLLRNLVSFVFPCSLAEEETATVHGKKNERNDSVLSRNQPFLIDFTKYFLIRKNS